MRLELDIFQLMCLLRTQRRDCGLFVKRGTGSTATFGKACRRGFHENRQKHGNLRPRLCMNREEKGERWIAVLHFCLFLFILEIKNMMLL